MRKGFVLFGTLNSLPGAKVYSLVDLYVRAPRFYFSASNWWTIAVQSPLIIGRSTSCRPENKWVYLDYVRAYYYYVPCPTGIKHQNVFQPIASNESSVMSRSRQSKKLPENYEAICSVRRWLPSDVAHRAVGCAVDISIQCLPRLSCGIFIFLCLAGSVGDHIICTRCFSRMNRHGHWVYWCRWVEIRPTAVKKSQQIPNITTGLQVSCS